MTQGTFLYFAYGSNMLTERLRRRCPSARLAGVATAGGYALGFCKRSLDGSAKATLLDGTDPTQAVHGVLYEIARRDLRHLDAAEGVGRGYDRDDGFAVTRLADGTRASASTYRAPAEACDHSLLPYDWYLALVLAGALQHRLPEGYAAGWYGLTATPDPLIDRPARQEALAVLREAGFEGLLAARFR